MASRTSGGRSRAVSSGRSIARRWIACSIALSLSSALLARASALASAFRPRHMPAAPVMAPTVGPIHHVSTALDHGNVARRHVYRPICAQSVPKRSETDPRRHLQVLRETARKPSIHTASRHSAPTVATAEKQSGGLEVPSSNLGAPTAGKPLTMRLSAFSVLCRGDKTASDGGAVAAHVRRSCAARGSGLENACLRDEGGSSAISATDCLKAPLHPWQDRRSPESGELRSPSRPLPAPDRPR